MAISAASLTGGIASLLLSAVVLCFDVPQVVARDMRAQLASTRHVHSGSSGKNGFHVTAAVEDVGHGEKRLIVRLEFGPGERDEHEPL